jgi:hypothetical protein
MFSDHWYRWRKCLTCLFELPRFFVIFFVELVLFRFFFFWRMCNFEIYSHRESRVFEGFCFNPDEMIFCAPFFRECLSFFFIQDQIKSRFYEKLCLVVCFLGHSDFWLKHADNCLGGSKPSDLPHFQNELRPPPFVTPFTKKQLLPPGLLL